jgi:hypothetical protein
MPNKGIALPIITTRGRVRVSDGEEQMSKIVLLALADGDSQNPFASDYGIRAPIFTLGTGSLRAVLDREIKQHFDRWEGGRRAKLVSAQMFGTADGSGRADRNGDFEIRIVYIDLETNTEHSVVKKITVGG